MESPADIAVAVGLVVAAGGFLYWRFAAKPQPPSCAPDAKVEPQVMVGSRLAKGLAMVQKEKRAPGWATRGIDDDPTTPPPPSRGP
jgi:hypothetical protein